MVADPAERRASRRRQQTVDEALDHAVEIMTEDGVGALSISEIARRMGIRGPSLYKYFPSLHAVYDALFARGLAASLGAMHATTEPEAPGVDRLRAAGRAVVRWAVDNPALAQLLYWRPVPGFEPSPSVFAASQQDMAMLRVELRQAVRRRQLSRRADSDDAVRLFTVVLSGVLSQQLANQPDTTYESGDFARLTDEAVEMFLAHYRPRRRT